jgi:hypothetical protein
VCSTKVNKVLFLCCNCVSNCENGQWWVLLWFTNCSVPKMINDEWSFKVYNFQKILIALSFAIQQTNVRYTLTLKYQFSVECLRALKTTQTWIECKWCSVKLIDCKWRTKFTTWQIDRLKLMYWHPGWKNWYTEMMQWNSYTENLIKWKWLTEVHWNTI